MVDRKNKKNNNDVAVPRWSGSAYSAANFSVMSPPPPENKKLLGFGSSKTIVIDMALQPIQHDDLKQGSLYIIKIRNVSVALFEGWDDDMCCFAVLRSDSTPMRWSEARYIPGDFDAYDAFDEAGNPPVHLWTRQLRVNVPTNWFSIFEEARRKQRDWQHEQNEEYYYPPVEQAPVPRQQASAAMVTPPATEISADDKATSSHHESEESEETSSSDAEEEDGEDEEIVSTADSSAPGQPAEPSEKSVKSEAVHTDHGPQNNGVTNAAPVAVATNEATPKRSATIGSAKQPRTYIREYEPTPKLDQTPKHEQVPKHEQMPRHEQVPKLEQIPAKHYLATPPVSPHASEQVRKYQSSSEKSRLFTSSDIAFSHNGDQFSLGHEIAPPVPQLPTNGNVKKTAAAAGSNGATTPKSKRRSVQDLFRGKN